MLAATAAGADETLIVKDLLGPEGPLYVDGNLYYVGWVSNTLSKWDGKTATVLNQTEGCGHNGLALTKDEDIPARMHQRSRRNPGTRHDR